jgi:hypothetical protein
LSIPPLATILNSKYSFHILIINVEPPRVGGYENHPWFSPCGPAYGCSQNRMEQVLNILHYAGWPIGEVHGCTE